MMSTSSVRLPESGLEGDTRRKTVVTSLLVPGTFEFWPSICLPVFTFQIPQMAALCILSRLYCHIQCQTQGADVLIHVTQNWNWDFFFNEIFAWGTWILNVTIKCVTDPCSFQSRTDSERKSCYMRLVGRDMWAATHRLWEPLIPLERSPRNYGYLRAFQKDNGWCLPSFMLCPGTILCLRLPQQLPQQLPQPPFSF